MVVFGAEGLVAAGVGAGGGSRGISCGVVEVLDGVDGGFGGAAVGVALCGCFVGRDGGCGLVVGVAADGLHDAPAVGDFDADEEVEDDGDDDAGPVWVLVAGVLGGRKGLR